MELANYVACICEGQAERAIIDILIDDNLLIFTRQEMLDEEVIQCRKGKNFEKYFEEHYLRKGFNSKISIIRILDSRKEKFRLSKAYEHKVDVINVITTPEIEILIILSENKYNSFKHSNQQPSEFCKTSLKMHNVKSYQFVKNYFSDSNKLVKAITEYHRVTKIQKNEFTLFDLLKKH
jgi:hypothetical protein